MADSGVGGWGWGGGGGRGGGGGGPGGPAPLWKYCTLFVDFFKLRYVLFKRIYPVTFRRKVSAFYVILMVFALECRRVTYIAS